MLETWSLGYKIIITWDSWVWVLFDAASRKNTEIVTWVHTTGGIADYLFCINGHCILIMPLWILIYDFLAVKVYNLRKKTGEYILSDFQISYSHLYGIPTYFYSEKERDMHHFMHERTILSEKYDGFGSGHNIEHMYINSLINWCSEVQDGFV